MKASRKSIHAKLYEFTYSSDLPKNLCSYFWKLVWAIIVFLPNLVFQLPGLVVSIFKKGKDAAHRRETGVMFYCGGSLLLLYCWITYHWIRAIFNCYSYNSELVYPAIFINIIIATIIITALIFEHKHNKKSNNDNKPNIITEFIKAKKNKYCPQIDWE